MKKEELEEIKNQITIYKEWRQVLQTGRFYGLRCIFYDSWLFGYGYGSDG